MPRLSLDRCIIYSNIYGKPSEANITSLCSGRERTTANIVGLATCIDIKSHLLSDDVFADVRSRPLHNDVMFIPARQWRSSRIQLRWNLLTEVPFNSMCEVFAMIFMLPSIVLLTPEVIKMSAQANVYQIPNEVPFLQRLLEILDSSCPMSYTVM